MIGWTCILNENNKTYIFFFVENLLENHQFEDQDRHERIIFK
jgi:hypothetical protein